MTKPLAHDHPRVIRCSPAMTAAMRRAMWPHGVSLSQVEAMERHDGFTPRTSAPAPVKAAAPTLLPRSVDTGFSRPPGGAVRGLSGGGSPVARTAGQSAADPTQQKIGPVNPLAAAASRFVVSFNRENS